MKEVTFEEFENAKLEIIRGVEFHEDTSTTQYGMMSKTYTTEKHGTFYEVTDPNKPGIIEFWSTKHPESRYYDDRSREEIIAQYEEKIVAIAKERDEYKDDMNKNGSMVIQLRMRIKELERILASINTLTSEVAA
jgi:hypothetical protein